MAAPVHHQKPDTLGALTDALVGNKNWYGVLCATRDFLSERGCASRWQRLHKDLIARTGTQHFHEVVLEALKHIPKERL